MQKPSHSEVTTCPCLSQRLLVLESTALRSVTCVYGYNCVRSLAKGRKKREDLRLLFKRISQIAFSEFGPPVLGLAAAEGLYPKHTWLDGCLVSSLDRLSLNKPPLCLEHCEAQRCASFESGATCPQCFLTPRECYFVRKRVFKTSFCTSDNSAWAGRMQGCQGNCTVDLSTESWKRKNVPLR